MIDTEGFVEPTVKLGSLYVAVTVGISIRLYPEFISTIILLVKLYYDLIEYRGSDFIIGIDRRATVDREKSDGHQGAHTAHLPLIFVMSAISS